MPQTISKTKIFEVIDRDTLQKTIDLYKLGEKVIIKSNYNITELLSVKYYKRMIDNMRHLHGNDAPKFVLDVRDNIGFYLEAIDLGFNFILVKETLFRKKRLYQRAKNRKINVFSSINKFFE